jgi:hypothetical protein
MASAIAVVSLHERCHASFEVQHALWSADDAAVGVMVEQDHVERLFLARRHSLPGGEEAACGRDDLSRVSRRHGIIATEGDAERVSVDGND